MRTALITGGAGFIGSHLAGTLLSEGWAVIVVDNFDPFYDEARKWHNLSSYIDAPNFSVIRADILNPDSILAAVEQPPEVIVHLAAKAGVRPSLSDPVTYQEVNVVGTLQLLELARRWNTKQFVFASSSSVYGTNPRVPWSEDDTALLPISPYASSKQSGESLGRVYSYLYGIRFLALRLFTVYGPRQRPDLAIHKFARLMARREAIPIFGDGSARRDYTYVGDAIAGIRAAMDYTGTGYEAINIGTHRTISVIEMVRALEKTSGIPAQIQWLPEEAGDVPQTFADGRKARLLLGYEPRTEFLTGLGAFWKWFNQTEPVATGGR
jgi:UDP-glucuronate 4-epimerase